VIKSIITVFIFDSPRIAHETSFFLLKQLSHHTCKLLPVSSTCFTNLSNIRLSFSAGNTVFTDLQGRKRVLTILYFIDAR